MKEMMNEMYAKTLKYKLWYSRGRSLKSVWSYDLHNTNLKHAVNCTSIKKQLYDDYRKRDFCSDPFVDYTQKKWRHNRRDVGCLVGWPLL
jgi:hypothetical protein